MIRSSKRNPGSYAAPGEWMVAENDEDVVVFRSYGSRGHGLTSAIVTVRTGDFIQYMGLARTLDYYHGYKLYRFILVRQDDVDIEDSGISFYVKNPESIFRFTREAEEE